MQKTVPVQITFTGLCCLIYDEWVEGTENQTGCKVVVLNGECCGQGTEASDRHVPSVNVHHSSVLFDTLEGYFGEFTPIFYDTGGDRVVQFKLGDGEDERPGLGSKLMLGSPGDVEAKTATLLEKSVRHLIDCTALSGGAVFDATVNPDRVLATIHVFGGRFSASDLARNMPFVSSDPITLGGVQFARNFQWNGEVELETEGGAASASPFRTTDNEPLIALSPWPAATILASVTNAPVFAKSSGGGTANHLHTYESVFGGFGKAEISGMLSPNQTDCPPAKGKA